MVKENARLFKNLFGVPSTRSYIFLALDFQNERVSCSKSHCEIQN